MRRLHAGLVLAAALGLSAAAQDHSAPDATSAPASTATHSQVSFAFTRVGLPVPKYKLTINSDGSGTYQGEYLIGVATTPAPFNRQVTISHDTITRIFKLSGQLDHFNLVCASKLKNIADTGTKILTYTGPDSTGSCTYNYSENKDVQALTEIMQAIAETMDRGRELDHLHRFDRLGLDSAISNLAQEVSEGRALEVGTIAPSLHSIANDGEVIQRVRLKASNLLAQAQKETVNN